MRHAGNETLDALEGLLVQLRKVDKIRERTRGVFYRNNRAFLHFHEDPAGIFADLQTDAGWERLDVTRVLPRRTLMSRVREILKDA